MAKTSSRLLFWWVVVGVVALDFVTKRLAVANLTDSGPVYLLGDWLSFRLVYNTGAAFGISVGPYSRWVFMVLAMVALVVLGAMVRQTPHRQWFRLLTLGLVCGGAIGNLIDRVRSPRGVVDFIDVWIGTFHWPTFNVADMAVSCGAIALAAVLWSEGKHENEAVAEAASAPETST
ncbi:MAG: signal peptidase II [Gemmatimonadota bacterium]|nr:MAG: signal peptidase II [Gemmatimonadota bacterium]